MAGRWTDLLLLGVCVAATTVLLIVTLDAHVNAYAFLDTPGARWTAGVVEAVVYVLGGPLPWWAGFRALYMGKARVVEVPVRAPTWRVVDGVKELPEYSKDGSIVAWRPAPPPEAAPAPAPVAPPAPAAPPPLPQKPVIRWR